MIYLQAFVTAKLLAVSMLSTWGTKLKGASDALGLVLWRKIANRKAVYSWSVFRMKRPPIKNNRKKPFNVSSWNVLPTSNTVKLTAIRQHLQFYPCHILGETAFCPWGACLVFVFRTAQLFPVPICHDHNDLWDHLACFLFSLLPSPWFPAHCYISHLRAFFSKMHADEQKRGFALKWRNEGMGWHAGKREISADKWT